MELFLHVCIKHKNSIKKSDYNYLAAEVVIILCKRLIAAVVYYSGSGIWT